MPNNGGTLPTLTTTLAAAGLVEREAIDLCLAIDPWCRTGGDPQENFRAMTTAHKLARADL